MADFFLGSCPIGGIITVTRVLLPEPPRSLVIPPAELQRLWDAHADRLGLVARALGGSAEDAVQEAFVQLALQAKLPEQPRAWLVRVVRNLVLQWHRAGRRRREREQLAGTANWFARAASAPATAALDTQEVTQHLLALDAPLREAIVLHIWGELSFDEIGAVTGSSRSTAHRRFQAGIRQLQTLFDAVEETLDNAN